MLSKQKQPNDAQRNPDYSVISRGKDEEEYSLPAIVKGTVQDLLDNGLDSQGKIVNGLDFPLPKASIEATKISSDIHAWDYTRGIHNTVRSTLYPTGHMRWGLAGTAHTMTFCHVDSDGFNTFGTILCGRKLWFFYREREGVPLSSIKTFVDEKFLLDEVAEDAPYDLEAIVLGKGDML